MNPAVLQALMGGKSLDEFIQERGEAIKEIGRRTSGYSLKTVNIDGHLHTPLYPVWKKKGDDAPKDIVAS
jgi:hypothetical protein